MPKVISVRTRGDFKKAEGILHRALQHHYRNKLEYYGELGVRALRDATPVDTGLTADSWSYEIVEEENRLTIWWRNSNVVNGIPVAILLQYGHGTATGGYVEGIDYVNPALKPVFDKMADEVWKEVTG